MSYPLFCGLILFCLIPHGYLRAKLLVIFTLFIFLLKAQPAFNWAKQFKGTGSDEGVTIKLDASGNIYTGGYFWGTTDFDPGPGTYTITASSTDGFVTKFDVNGNLLWAAAFKGAQGEAVHSIALDDSSNIYVSGMFGSNTDFDPGPGVYTLSPISTEDLFILKLNSNGNLKWVKQIGGTWFQWSGGIAVDKKGNNYITGHFSASVDFDPGPGVYAMNVISGPINGFILKLNNSGNFVWAKQFISSGSVDGVSVVVDAFENVYSTGYFGPDADLDPGPGTYTFSSPGAPDIYVSKLDKNGDFVWAKQMGGGSSDYPNTIALDQNKNVYTGGYFSNSGDFDPGPGVYTLPGPSSCGFISRLDSAGNFIWARQITGGAVNGLAVDAFSNVAATGQFGGTVDLDPGYGFDTIRSKGRADAFVVSLNVKGFYKCGGTMGGSDNDNGAAIALDNYQNMYVTGWFADTVDFDCGAGVYDMISTAASNSFEKGNIFVTKYSACGLVSDVAETKENDLFKIYPNPSSGIFSVSYENELKGTRIDIHDVLGNYVYNKSISDNSKIDLSYLPKGIYFLEASLDGNKVRKKIILE
jgi:hypothetical protein